MLPGYRFLRRDINWTEICPDWMNAKTIARRLGLSPQRTRAILRQAVVQKTLDRMVSGRVNYYRSKRDEDGIKQEDD